MRAPFEDTVQQHGPTVLRVCRAVLGATPDAEDAWSETFISALRAWPELPEQTNVQAWLVRVAGRRCVDLLRARRPVPVDPELVQHEPSTRGLPGGGDPDLWRAVATLPTQQRLAVAHHWIGGLSHAQTAELIGSTPTAVRRAASDGLARLRIQLGPTHDPHHRPGGAP